MIINDVKILNAIKIHEKTVGYDEAGNELKVFYVRSLEIVEQFLTEMVECVRKEMACNN